MSRREDARLAALRSFDDAVEGGADKNSAVALAVASYCEIWPSGTEPEIREWLARRLAERRLSKRLKRSRERAS
jgi:hypothetical protein